MFSTYTQCNHVKTDRHIKVNNVTSYFVFVVFIFQNYCHLLQYYRTARARLFNIDTVETYSHSMFEDPVPLYIHRPYGDRMYASVLNRPLKCKNTQLVYQASI